MVANDRQVLGTGGSLKDWERPKMSRGEASLDKKMVCGSSAVTREDDRDDKDSNEDSKGDRRVETSFCPADLNVAHTAE